jgi:hypothetical protein
MEVLLGVLILKTTQESSMPNRPQFCALLTVGLLSGCQNLSRSIEQRVAVSEECRALTATAPMRWGQPGPIASFQLGNVGRCDLKGEDSLIALCTLNRITARYGLSGEAPPHDGIKDAYSVFRTDADKLRSSLNALATLALALDAFYKKYLKERPDAGYTQITGKMQEVEKNLVAIREELDKVRLAQNKLHASLAVLNASLDAQVQAELAAWDANLRVQLAQFEQLLSGDLTLLLRAGMQDQVLTHVARRSLELLHGALKPADAVINRLDEKAYGAVSVSYLAFGPNIQDAVNKALDSVKARYAERIEKSGAADKSVEPFMTEMKRAACDNLVQGTQFSMLSELVDTMLIARIPPPGDTRGGKQAVRLPASLDTQLSRPEASRTQAMPELAGLAADEAASSGTFLFEVAATAPVAPAVPVSASPPAELSPFGVYAVNEWTARQQLLTQKLVARSEALAASGKTVPPPGVTTVEESTVRRLAEAATAQSIDDAVRLDPSMLALQPTDTGPRIANNINVTTAASAVSLAAVALQVNLSVSNVNSFNPTNNNTVAPVVNVAVPAALPPPAPAPSAAATGKRSCSASSAPPSAATPARPATWRRCWPVPASASPTTGRAMAWNSTQRSKATRPCRRQAWRSARRPSSRRRRPAATSTCGASVSKRRNARPPRPTAIASCPARAPPARPPRWNGPRAAP